MLVEVHDTIEEAIAREKMLKNWNRVWKLRLIAEATRIGMTFGIASMRKARVSQPGGPGLRRGDVRPMALAAFPV